MRTLLTCILLAPILLLGCEMPSVVRSNTNVIDMLQKQYKIYDDLERHKNVTENQCTVLFNDPEDGNVNIGASGRLPDRDTDRTAWLDAISQGSGTSGSFPDLPEEATSSAPPPGSSPTSRLLGNDGGVATDNSGFSSDPIPFGNNAFSSGNTPGDFSSEEPVRTFGTQENTLFTLTIREISPVDFNNIQVTHLASSSATVETVGVAQLTMKDASTNRLTAQPYDSVGVLIKYFLQESPRGVWECMERTVNITTTPAGPGSSQGLRGTPPPSNTIVRW